MDLNKVMKINSIITMKNTNSKSPLRPIGKLMKLDMTIKIDTPREGMMTAPSM